MKDFAYIILSHKINKFIIYNLNRIQNELSDICDIWFVYDKSYISNISKYNIENTFKFSYKEINKKYKVFDSKWGQPHKGNSIFPIFEFYKNYKYKKYIVQEYDTIYNKSYKDLINKINILNNDIDILFESKLEDVTEWYWYNDKQNIDNHILLNIEEKNIKHVLLNFYCISYNALSKLFSFYLQGNYGHYEMILPTFAINNTSIKIDFLYNYNINSYFDFNKLGNDHIKEIVINNDNDILIHPIKNTNQYKLLFK